jgi:hypothetical protein
MKKPGEQLHRSPGSGGLHTAGRLVREAGESRPAVAPEATIASLGCRAATGVAIQRAPDPSGTRTLRRSGIRFNAAVSMAAGAAIASRALTTRRGRR